MEEELIGYLFFAGLVTGVIGLFLGMIVDKSAAGFLLGAFLGPLGWIIVFLLPRDSEYKKESVSQSAPQMNTTPPSPEGTDLSSDSYRLYLGKKYDIQRNDLFQQFECKEKLFETLDEVMVFADELEAKERIEKKKQKGLGRNLSWLTIKDNLLRENITVDSYDRDSSFIVREDDKSLKFYNLEELQDYYISKIPLGR